MRFLTFSLGLITLLVYATGCSPAPCETSSQCGSGEVCANQRCQSLSCDRAWAAVDPTDGRCKTLSGCTSDVSVRAWVSCADPCDGLGEFACTADTRCQPIYATDPNKLTPTTGACPQPFGGDVGCGGGGGGGERTFVGCRANAQPANPCDKLDELACKADTRCVYDQLSVGAGCDCSGPLEGDCNCPPVPAPSFECRPKTCGDYTTAAECSAHPECEASQGGGTGCGCPPDAICDCGGFDAGTGFGGCFQKFFGCSGMDEKTCLSHPECHPVGEPCYCPPGADCACGGGKFLFCEADDGLQRCNADADCGSGERCSNGDGYDVVCAPAIGSSGGGFATPTGSATVGAGMTGVKSDPIAPSTCPGICVPQGCKGYGEAHCTADPSCEPVYQLQCSPYGGGLAFDCGGGPLPPNAGAPAPCGGGSGCEPSFVGCVDAPTVLNVDAERSVLVRDPVVVDDPSFAFSTVMAALANGKDPNAFATAWLGQITQPLTVNGRVAAARSGARDYLAGLPRRSDGNLDVAKLGFQVTSLSNRLDLAGPQDCGEARITYAMSAGITDRRHRMTVIVELRQPDDGAGCVEVARQWTALSKLSGGALANALKLIYVPLLQPATLNQVRTNEFLVGPQTTFDPAQNEPWELREWRLGTDGQLHLAPSKQALDPQIANDFAVVDWVAKNRDALVAGKATLPDTFLAVTSSENGARIFLDDFEASNAINKQSCAGCHTTESNTAFVHVGERFHGTGRAQISKFLQDALAQRALHLASVAAGKLTMAARSLPKAVH